MLTLFSALDIDEPKSTCMPSIFSTKVNANTVCPRYLNISISIIALDLIFAHYGTFTRMCNFMWYEHLCQVRVDKNTTNIRCPIFQLCQNNKLITRSRQLLSRGAVCKHSGQHIHQPNSKLLKNVCPRYLYKICHISIELTNLDLIFVHYGINYNVLHFLWYEHLCHVNVDK